MPSAKNIEMLAQLVRTMRDADLLVLTDYRGLSVAQMAELRGRLRQAGAEYHVAKNTLLALAAREVGIGGLSAQLVGPTAIAFVSGDAVAALAKVLMGYARTSDFLTVKGGVVSKRAIAAGELAAVAALPPRGVLLAQLVSEMQSPIAGLIGVLEGVLSELVGTLNAPLRDLIGILEARANQLKASAS